VFASAVSAGSVFNVKEVSRISHETLPTQGLYYLSGNITCVSLKASGLKVWFACFVQILRSRRLLKVKLDIQRSNKFPRRIRRLENFQLRITSFDQRFVETIPMTKIKVIYSREVNLCCFCATCKTFSSIIRS
jgi:hypothetical protein